MSNYIPNRIIQKVRERANQCCEYCLVLSQYSFHPFCIEHIQPKSKGGSNLIENLALSCQNCNSSKYDKTSEIDPLTQNEVSIFNPRNQTWSNHFI